MNSIYGDSIYTGNSIIFSRLFQENISLSQGVTGYGVIANLINVHIHEIDKIAEYAGAYFSQRDIEKRYADQYGRNAVSGTFNRTFTGSQKAYENQAERRDSGFIKALTIEGGIKIGARIIQKWTGEREKYQCLAQVYRILLAYAKEDPSVTERKNLIRELSKIRNSFPLSANERIKLSEISVDGLDVFETDFPILKVQNNQELRENIAYLLYVLYVQKYGESIANEKRLFEYYDLLGFRSLEADELLRENKNSYDIITTDQLKYLIISRSMVKNLEISVPNIDVNAIARRTVEMAENDPYRIREKKVLRAPIGGQKRLSDIFFESPFVVINAGATALSQFTLDSDAKEKVRGQMTEWGLDDDAINNIMEEADNIKEESKEVK